MLLLLFLLMFNNAQGTPLLLSYLWLWMCNEWRLLSNLQKFLELQRPVLFFSKKSPVCCLYINEFVFIPFVKFFSIISHFRVLKVKMQMWKFKKWKSQILQYLLNFVLSLYKINVLLVVFAYQDIFFEGNILIPDPNPTESLISGTPNICVRFSGEINIYISVLLDGTEDYSSINKFVLPLPFNRRKLYSSLGPHPALEQNLGSLKHISRDQCQF